MSTATDSPLWHRVRDLAPRLRSHVEVRRHVYRAQRWYVLDDRSAGRTHRLDENAYRLVAGMDGSTPLKRLWSRAQELAGDDAPTQDETIRLLGQLHSVDLIQCELPPDARDTLLRRTERQAAGLTSRLRSPFVIRLPLIDPESILARLALFGRAVFSRTGLLLFGAWVAGAVVTVAMNWPAMAAQSSERLSSPSSLALMLLVYPVVKALHELGHALAVKAWGGEVHDTGIMLLVFMPVPYVDATAANAFEDKWARIAVAGAGIAVELGLAALGAYVWLLVEPGLVRGLALDLMIIGGVSTLVFNGNPLLRFDGYYVLADFVEIPNLASRSSTYYGYLIRRYLFGATEARSPVFAAGERGWFVGYGAAAFAYKAFILAAILMFVLQVSLLLGIVLGAWAIAGQVVVPAGRNLRRLLQDTGRAKHRARGLVSVLGLVAMLIVAVTVPVPQRSTAEGVIWLAEDAYVRVGEDCFVQRLLAEPGSTVTEGTPLLECSAPLIQAELRLAEARLAELTIKALGERRVDRARGQLADDKIAVARAEVRAMRERVQRLVVLSAASGTLFVPAERDLPGRFLRQGEVVAYVMGGDDIDVRVAVAQADIGLVRGKAEGAQVRLAHQPDRVYEANVIRAMPGATRDLPSPALGVPGGGLIAVSPDDAEGRTAVDPVFQLHLRLVGSERPRFTGERAHVRFDHGRSPLGAQAFRWVRQLFLRRLGV